MSAPPVCLALLLLLLLLLLGLLAYMPMRPATPCPNDACTHSSRPISGLWAPPSRLLPSCPPAEWRDMSNLGTLMLHSNHLNGSLPVEWAAGPLTSSLKLLSLHKNQLGGAFPASWSSFATPSPPTGAGLQCLHLGFNPGLCGQRPANLPYADCPDAPAGTLLGQYQRAACMHACTHARRRRIPWGQA